MIIEESYHWQRKKRFRKNIEHYMVEYVINNSRPLADKHYKNALNGIVRIPQTGKRLKVVFRKIEKDRIKLITAYYLD